MSAGGAARPQGLRGRRGRASRDVLACACACLLLPRKFVFFNIPQIQYKNPWVQIMLFKNMTPSPFLRFYLGRCPDPDPCSSRPRARTAGALGQPPRPRPLLRRAPSGSRRSRKPGPGPGPSACAVGRRAPLWVIALDVSEGPVLTARASASCPPSARAACFPCSSTAAAFLWVFEAPSALLRGSVGQGGCHLSHYYNSFLTDNGEQVLVDVEDKTNKEITEHIKKILGKSK